MAVDFQSVLRVRSAELDRVKSNFRIGRLRQTALRHFQRKLADYFTRLAYNEWYPLNHDQFNAYRDERVSGGDEAPAPTYSWQKTL